MATDDDLVEVSPCPNCRSPLTVSVADLGHLVECPSCSTQFRARRLGAEPMPRMDRPRDRDDLPDDEPRRFRSRSSDDDDDRPRVPSRSRRRPYDEEYDDLGERDRDRDRRRFRDDDDFDRPRRSRQGKGAATAMGVIHLIFAGLVLLCGCINVGGSIFIRDWAKQNNAAVQGANLRPGQLEHELRVMMIAGVVYTLSTGLYLTAGLTTLNRARSARGFTIACVIFSMLALMFQIVNGAIAIKNGDLDDVAPPELIGMFIGLLIWISYIVTTLILLSKSRRQFA